MDKKNELVRKICQDIVSIDRLSRDDWDAVSLVMDIVTGRFSNSGFVYRSDGKIEPVSVGGFTFADSVLELRSLMQVPGEDPWRRCLVQIRRRDGKIRIDFNSNDDGRWEITPKTFKRMRDELRPVFD